MDSQKAIARIPPEIFSAIFSLVPNDHSLNVTQGLWPLGRVCSFWRSIILSDPTSWTHLNISGSLPGAPAQQDDQCSRYPWRPQVLSEYLSRSANLSLHITIDYAHASMGSDLNVKMFYQTLYAQSHRFASLSHCTLETMRMLTLPDVFDFPNLRHLTITLPISFPFYLFSTPTLETCCISFDDYYSPPSPNQRPPLQCPTNLRELILKGRANAVGQVPIGAFQLATAPLTSLTIDHLGLSPSIIQTLPQAQKLYITTRKMFSKKSISPLIQLIEHRLDCGIMRHVTYSGYIYEPYDPVFWGRIDALNARKEVTFTLTSIK
ncbi:hypothetical protein ARMSODRAFT_447556 [Armillaria solidipes]|uniref:F-box domain-containing protein n=1 Tax=Armillaria solidipes TaxID=1076256 RepID=A0A2H3BDU4_9AGAR|nr:hypothetical protein ARMSODRAFT_447556 [Armillaria solidipes]